MNSATFHSETLPWPYANAAAIAYVEQHRLTPEPWESLRKQIADLLEPPVFALHAVRVLQGFWPQYADECRAVLAKAVAAPLDVPDDELMLHIYCGYLLAEHRDLQCFDIAQQLVQLSRDDCEELLGEDWPDTMEAWLASLCGEHEAGRRWLIERAYDVRLSNSMRHSMVSALVRCVNSGVHPASRLHTLIFELIDSIVACLPNAKTGVNHLAPDDDHMDDRALIGLLICLLDEFSFDDHAATMARLKPYFVAGVVDTQVVDWEYFEREGLSAGSRRPTLPGCTVAEIDWWACFREQAGDADWLDEDDEFDDLDGDRETHPLRTDPGYLDAFETDQPFVRETPKVGRNEPCPCGSGKKFKKCCGA